MPTSRILHMVYNRSATVGSAMPDKYVPVTPAGEMWPEKWHDFVYRLNIYQVYIQHNDDASNLNTFTVIAADEINALDHVGAWIDRHMGIEFPLPPLDLYTIRIDHLADIGGYVQGVIAYSYVW